MSSLSQITTLEEIFLQGNILTCKNKNYMQELRIIIPSLQVIDDVDVTNTNIIPRPLTAGGIRPSTPFNRNVNHLKDAIPLIRPSSAREGGLKRVLFFRTYIYIYNLDTNVHSLFTIIVDFTNCRR